MKLSALVLLALLGCSLAQGWIVSKCELRDQLIKAISDLTQGGKQRGLAGESLVAKIVCHVEQASAFNTSAVNELISGRENHLARRRRRAASGGLFSLAQEVAPVTTVGPQTQGPAEGPAASTSPSPDEEVWTLYGLFQLSNHLVCSDGSSPSPNICQTSCSTFVDDDIRDDINCVLKLLTDLVENGFASPHWESLRKLIRLIFQEVCRDVQASEYFAEC